MSSGFFHQRPVKPLFGVQVLRFITRALVSAFHEIDIVKSARLELYRRRRIVDLHLNSARGCGFREIVIFSPFKLGINNAKLYQLIVAMITYPIATEFCACTHLVASNG
jgi:hypothetical protein